MKQWIVVVLSVAALSIGASAPTLIVETIRPGSIAALSPSGPPQEQHDLSANRGDTRHIALPVTILPGPEHEAEAAEQKQHAAESAITEKDLADATWKLAYFTLALAGFALFQVLLFYWQLRIINESLRDTKIAAIAADESAKTAADALQSNNKNMRILESAYIFAGVGGSGRLQDGHGNALSTVRISVSAVNHGRTAGFVDSISYVITEDTGIYPVALPSTHDEYDKMANVKKIFVGWTLGPRTGEQQREVDRRITPLPKPLLFHGLFTYTDVFGDQHWCGFAFRMKINGSLDAIERLDAYARHDKRGS